jgi:hypothetical protein
MEFQGTTEDVMKRLSPRASQGDPAAAQDHPGREVLRGPGRPRLGVVARELTLLPRHWDWLNSQPGAASVALGKLVELARREKDGRDRVCGAQEATHRFMSATAGNVARLRGGDEGPVRQGSRAIHRAHPRLARRRSKVPGVAGLGLHATQDGREPPTAPLNEN